MPNTQFNVDALKTEAVRPLYVVAGATDLAVEIARGYVNEAQVKVADAQKKATERVRSGDFEPKALQSRAVELVNAYVTDTITDLNDTCAELAVRGENLVTRLRRQQTSQDLKAAARTTTSKARATKTSAKKGASASKSRAKATGTTAKKSAQATRSNIKATGTSAKKTAKKSTQAVSDASRKIGA